MNKTTTTNEIDYTKATSIYDFVVKDTYQMDVKLGEYCRGIVTLIVNIGSACGLTAANYDQLTQINKDFDGSKIGKLFNAIHSLSFKFYPFSPIFCRDSYLDFPMQPVHGSNARERWR